MTEFIMPKLPKGITAQDLTKVKAPPLVAKWRTANRKALAGFMDKLPSNKHKQNTFCGLGGNEETGFCGTRSCALGWFMMGGLSPHMQWTFFEAQYQKALRYGNSSGEIDPDRDGLTILPVLNNVIVVSQEGFEAFRAVGKLFFGEQAYDHVFNRGAIFKESLVDELMSDPGLFGLGVSSPRDRINVLELAKIIVKEPQNKLSVFDIMDGKRWASREAFWKSERYRSLVRMWT